MNRLRCAAFQFCGETLEQQSSNWCSAHVRRTVFLVCLCDGATSLGGGVHGATTAVGGAKNPSDRSEEEKNPQENYGCLPYENCGFPGVCFCFCELCTESLPIFCLCRVMWEHTLSSEYVWTQLGLRLGVCVCVSLLHEHHLTRIFLADKRIWDVWGSFCTCNAIEYDYRFLKTKSWGHANRSERSSDVRVYVFWSCANFLVEMVRPRQPTKPKRPKCRKQRSPGVSFGPF